jgi:hypothetical protein
MRKHLMSAKILFATAPAVVASLGLMATGVMAGSSDHNAQPASPAAYSRIQHHRHLARHESAPGFGYSAYSAAGSIAPDDRGPAYVQMPGYVYVPGKGILDEACNLPTSTCPNEMRDVQ